SHDRGCRPAVTLLVQSGTLGHGPSTRGSYVATADLQAAGHVVRPESAERDRVDVSVEMVDGEHADIASCHGDAQLCESGRDCPGTVGALVDHPITCLRGIDDLLRLRGARQVER